MNHNIPTFKAILFIIIAGFFVLGTAEVVRRSSFDIRQRAQIYVSPTPAPTPTLTPDSKVTTCPSACENGCKVSSTGTYECIPLTDNKVELQKTCDLNKCKYGCKNPTLDGGDCIMPTIFLEGEYCGDFPDICVTGTSCQQNYCRKIAPVETIVSSETAPVGPEAQIAQISAQSGINITYSGSLQARQASSLSEFNRLMPPQLMENTRAIRLYDTYGLNSGDRVVSGLNRDGALHIANTANSFETLVYQAGLNNQETRVVSQSCPQSATGINTCSAIDAFVNAVEEKGTKVNVLGYSSQSLTSDLKCSSSIITEQFGCLQVKYVTDSENLKVTDPQVYDVFKSLYNQEYELKTGADNKEFIEILKN